MGIRLFRQTDRRPVYLFTIHKAASSFVGLLLGRVLARAGFRHVDPKNDAWQVGVDCSKGDVERFHQDGIYYGPFRAPFGDIEKWEGTRIILQVRHPLDVLTSHYFSVKYSHALPEDQQSRRQWIEFREELNRISIDEYVLAESDGFRETYEAYLDRFVTRPQVLVVKYESMVGDFVAWLDSIVRFLGLERNCRVMYEVRRCRRKHEASFSIAREDPTQHMRRVQPGDHLCKLQPATIQRLTRRFDRVLTGFGYPTSNDDEVVSRIA